MDFQFLLEYKFLQYENRNYIDLLKKLYVALRVAKEDFHISINIRAERAYPKQQSKIY